MTTVLDAAALPVVWMIVRMSLLLASAGLAHALLARRMSAAARHLLLTLAIVGLLILPALSAVIPGWNAVRLPAPAHREAAPAATSAERSNATDAVAIPAALQASSTSAIPPSTSSARVQSSTVLFAMYVIGMLLQTIRLAKERLMMRQLARRSVDVSD